MKQLPEDFKNCSSLTPLTEQTGLTPAVKQIHNVLHTPQVGQCTPEEVFNAVKQGYYKAYADTGFKMVGTEEEIDQTAIYQITQVAKYVREIFAGMRLGEIPICFDRGIRKHYGDYMGLSVVTLYQFIDGYIKHQDRQNALLELYRVKNLPGEPTAKEIFDLAKSNALHTLKEVRDGRDINYIAAVVYDFLDRLGMIDFTTQEKRDMMTEARRITTLEYTTKKIDPVKRIDQAWILEALIDPTKPQQNIENMLKWRAKALALKTYLEGVILEEVDFDKLIESKRNHD